MAIYSIRSINSRIRSDVRGFVEECDAAYEAKISAAAEQILAHMNESPIVLIAGPSGSGKTTSAQKIDDALEKRGVHAKTISLDDYYLDVGKGTPLTENGAYDLESPLCLDMELLHRHFSALSAGETVDVPHFDFTHQRRCRGTVTPLRLEKNEIAVFEGIHALNDSIAGRHPESFKLYISAHTDIGEGTRVIFKHTWIRLARRAVRDFNFRGADAANTMNNWPNVRRGEKMYISPFRNRADLQIDTMLPYEVSILRNYAEPMFKAIPKENQRRREMLDMIEAFDAFTAIDPSLAAPNALVREFIGGGIYRQ